MFWESAGKSVRCLACARGCLIAPGSRGFCGVRKNSEGKLVSEVYGRPAAVNIDPIEKKPFFHFLPGTLALSIGTVGCNFRCAFCQNWDISQNTDCAGSQLSPQRAVELAKQVGARSVSLTYNEPTVFIEYALDICKAAKAAQLKTNFVTNGYQSRHAWKALHGLLDAVNIDLKGDDEFYKRLCGARLQPVLDSISTAHELGIWIEITTLVIPGENEHCLKQIADFIAQTDPEIPWHVTAFHPDYKMRKKAPTNLESLLRAREIGLKSGLKYVYIGNLPNEYESTFCPSCGARLIARSGFFVQSKIKHGKCKCGQRIAGVWND